MSARNGMSNGGRCEYLKVMQGRYRQAEPKERGRLLDEMEAITGLDRKHLIKLMGKPDLKRRSRSRERGRIYGGDVKMAVSLIAESCDYICAERLAGNLAWLASHLQEHGELAVSEELAEKLAGISTSSIRRLLAGIAKDEYYLPRAKRKGRNSISQDIPMKRLPWNEKTPGHFEVDLVFHCGSDPSGEFACSLHMVDIASGWSELAAILGRSQLVVEDAFQRILTRLPFPVLQLHPDNGGELLNHHLLRLWQEWVPGLQWSRSRPYEKNDNRFVEQKNSSVVRAYLGYQRLDTVEQVRAMNCLYDKLWLYYNFFQPVLRLKEKHYLHLESGEVRLKRSYGQAQTPWDRLLATGVLSEAAKQALLSLKQQTNPRQLRVEIHELADAILRSPSASRSARSQNVYATLYRQPAQPLPAQEVVIV